MLFFALNIFAQQEQGIKTPPVQMASCQFPVSDQITVNAGKSQEFYDAGRRYWENALEGKLSSGNSPDHPRYSDRTTL
jgi:hypothetical protein